MQLLATQPALLYLVYLTGFVCFLAEHFVGGGEEGYGGGGYRGLDQLHLSLVNQSQLQVHSYG